MKKNQILVDEQEFLEMKEKQALMEQQLSQLMKDKKDTQDVRGDLLKIETLNSNEILKIVKDNLIQDKRKNSANIGISTIFGSMIGILISMTFMITIDASFGLSSDLENKFFSYVLMTLCPFTSWCFFKVSDNDRKRLNDKKLIENNLEKYISYNRDTDEVSIKEDTYEEFIELIKGNSPTIPIRVNNTLIEHQGDKK